MLQGDVIMTNIYALAECRGVAIKEIEKAADLSIGYLSRLKRDGNGDKLSVKNMEIIARMLKTQVDVLLYSDVVALEEAVLTVKEFLVKLARKTLDGDIGWQRSGLYIGKVLKPLEVSPSLESQHHPLTQWMQEDNSSIVVTMAGMGKRRLCYRSLFYGEDECSHVEGVEVYSTYIRRDTLVYLAKVYYPTVADENKTVLEAYINSGDVLNPLFKEHFTEQIGEEGVLQRLYGIIQQIRNKPRLQPKMQDLMKEFIEND